MSKRGADEDLRDPMEYKRRDGSVAENRETATQAVDFKPSYIIKILNTPEFALHPAPPDQSSFSGWGIAPGDCLRIGAFCREGNSKVAQVEVGRLKKLNRGDRKYVFVADPGKDVLIIKAMMYKDKSNKALNSIKFEYDSNLAIFKKDAATAFNTIVPTFCYAAAAYQTQVGAKAGDAWLDGDTLKILLQPRHIQFSRILRDLSFSDDDRRQFWKSGWLKLKQLHGLARTAHRDVKVDNAVVKSVAAESGQLVPVRPLEILWIDVTEAAGLDKFTANVVAGTPTYVSVSVLNSWMFHWYTSESLRNPLISKPPPKQLRPDSRTGEGGEDLAPEPDERDKSAETREATRKSVEKHEGEESSVQKHQSEASGSVGEGEESVAKKDDMAMSEVFGREMEATMPETEAWDADCVESFRYLLAHKRSEYPQAENDLWSWGMSLLGFLDPDYVQRVAIPSSFWDGYKAALSAEGIPECYTKAFDRVTGVRFFYSPIYDRKTYRLKEDSDGNQISDGKVKKEWWPLLKTLLARPETKLQLGNVKVYDEVNARIARQFDVLSALPENMMVSASTPLATAAKPQGLADTADAGPSVDLRSLTHQSGEGEQCRPSQAERNR